MQPPRYYNSRRASRQSVPRRHPIRRWQIVGAVILVIGLGVVLATQHAIAARQSAEAATLAAHQQELAAKLQQTIAADTTDSIGVAIRNVTTGEVRTYGQTSAFQIASTEKILSALLYYHRVETGRASLDAVIGAYPASFQIKTMINISNNEAWYLVNDAVGGNAALQKYADSIGIPYRVDGNMMSAAAMTTLLAKLYRGELLNGIHTRALLSYMQHTNEESMLPAATNDNVTVYHKYGELDDTLHDVGIVTDGAQTYAIAIYTKGTSSRMARIETIRQLSAEALALCGW